LSLLLWLLSAPLAAGMKVIAPSPFAEMHIAHCTHGIELAANHNVWC